MHENDKITGPLNPVAARNDVARLHANGANPDAEVEAAARAKLATAKIDKAIREATAACPVPLHPAQVEYLVGLIENAGKSK